MFSVREEKIIKIIGRKKMTLEEIGKELFKQDEAPFDSTISVSNAVNRIIKKTHYYKLGWTLTKKRENNKLYIKKQSLNKL